MEFKEVCLKDILQEIIDYRGKTPKKLGGDWSKTGIRALSAKNIKTGKIVQEETIRFVDDELYKKWMKQEIEKGTILITSEAPFGEIFYWNSEEKIVLSQRIFGIKVNKDNNSQYVYYYMMTRKFKAELDSRATGSTVTGLRQPELLKCKIKIPNKVYQDKITKILSNIDKKMELNNQINENLLEQAITIFKDRFPKVEQGNEIIGNYLIPKKGKNLLSRDTVKGNVPVVAGGLEPATYHNISNTKSPVITISASGANAGVVNLWNVPVWSSDSSFIDYSITENVYFWYVALKIRQKEIYDSQTGSAQPHIYPKHIAELSINSLEKDRVNKYTKIVTPLFEMIGKSKEENKHLEQLRDTLLPKLMNGEIDLENIGI